MKNHHKMLLRFLFGNDIKFSLDVLETSSFGEIVNLVSKKINLDKDFFDLSLDGEVLDDDLIVQESEVTMESEISILEIKDQCLLALISLKRVCSSLHDGSSLRKHQEKEVFLYLSYLNDEIVYKNKETVYLALKYLHLRDYVNYNLVSLLCDLIEQNFDGERDQLIDMIFDDSFEIDLSQKVKLKHNSAIWQNYQNGWIFKNGDYYTPFIHAMNIYNFNLARKMLRYRGGEYTQTFEYDLIFLAAICESYNKKYIKFFLEEEKNLEYEPISVLKYSIVNDNFDLFDLLLRMGTDSYEALKALAKNIDCVSDTTRYFYELFRRGLVTECIQMAMRIKNPSMFDKWIKF